MRLYRIGVAATLWAAISAGTLWAQSHSIVRFVDKPSVVTPTAFVALHGFTPPSGDPPPSPPASTPVVMPYEPGPATMRPNVESPQVVDHFHQPVVVGSCGYRPHCGMGCAPKCCAKPGCASSGCHTCLSDLIGGWFAHAHSCCSAPKCGAVPKCCAPKACCAAPVCCGSANCLGQPLLEGSSEPMPTPVVDPPGAVTPRVREGEPSGTYYPRVREGEPSRPAPRMREADPRAVPPPPPPMSRYRTSQLESGWHAKQDAETGQRRS